MKSCHNQMRTQRNKVISVDYYNREKLRSSNLRTEKYKC